MNTKRRLSTDFIHRAWLLLDRGITVRQVERELRELGASKSVAKRAISEVKQGVL